MARKQHRDGARRWRVRDAGNFRLAEVDPGKTPGIHGRKAAEQALAAIQERMQSLQQALYAESRQALLVVLQAMDTGGKDGTVRHVFGPLNPQGVRVTGFKVPTPEEAAHDFLWRIHREAPAHGMIGVFNRSHYEDVLVARVHRLADRKTIAARYEQINDFERMLQANGTRVLKCFLHISKQEQKARLLARLDTPRKRWKYNPADLAERRRWPAYRNAYQAAIRACSPPDAPWHVIPADHKWYRNWAVATVVLQELERMAPRYPKPAEAIEGVEIPD